jgi:hypothetical protein
MTGRLSLLLCMPRFDWDSSIHLNLVRPLVLHYIMNVSHRTKAPIEHGDQEVYL